MKNPFLEQFETMFGGMFAGSAPASVRERAAARLGEAPEPRRCDTREDLADWFTAFGIAVGTLASHR